MPNEYSTETPKEANETDPAVLLVELLDVNPKYVGTNGKKHPAQRMLDDLLTAAETRDLRKLADLLVVIDDISLGMTELQNKAILSASETLLIELSTDPPQDDEDWEALCDALSVSQETCDGGYGGEGLDAGTLATNPLSSLEPPAYIKFFSLARDLEVPSAER